MGRLTGRAGSEQASLATFLESDDVRGGPSFGDTLDLTEGGGRSRRRNG